MLLVDIANYYEFSHPCAVFSGTVSRDGFGFREHAWSVLGLNRRILKIFRCSNNLITQKVNFSR
jgi:hypothetical protein